MNKLLKIGLTLVLIALYSCNQKSKETVFKGRENEGATAQKKHFSKAEQLVDKTIEAHGGEAYDTASYGFRFRDKSYSFHNSKNGYRYSVKSTKDRDSIEDVLKNGQLTRTINGKPIELSVKDNAKYTEALNSVIYFATLPHKLKDNAVNKTYEGQATIKGQAYDLLGISFDKEGGGKDYDDKFLYWINTDTKTIDYLAYSYSTNDGGVRFRSAFNPRTVDGIRFQDYINYEVTIGTPLKELSVLYEKGSLKELSKILTEEVLSK